MTIKFPKRLPDGSFVVDLRFVGNASASALAEWLTAWRILTTASWNARSDDDELRWSNNFVADAEVLSGQPDLSIRIHARADSRRWKDWIVQLAHDLEKAFENVRFSHFDSLEREHSH